MMYLKKITASNIWHRQSGDSKCWWRSTFVGQSTWQQWGAFRLFPWWITHCISTTFDLDWQVSCLMHLLNVLKYQLTFVTFDVFYIENICDRTVKLNVTTIIIFAQCSWILCICLTSKSQIISLMKHTLHQHYIWFGLTSPMSYAFVEWFKF